MRTRCTPPPPPPNVDHDAHVACVERLEEALERPAVHADRGDRARRRAARGCHDRRVRLDARELPRGALRSRRARRGRRSPAPRRPWQRVRMGQRNPLAGNPRRSGN